MQMYYVTIYVLICIDFATASDASECITGCGFHDNNRLLWDDGGLARHGLTPVECQRACREHSDCVVWDLETTSGVCHIRTQDGPGSCTEGGGTNYIAGGKDCVLGYAHLVDRWCNSDKVVLSSFDSSSGAQECIDLCLSNSFCAWVGHRRTDNYCELWGQGSCVNPHNQPDHDIYEVTRDATRLPSTSPSRRPSGSPSHVPSSQKPTPSPSELPSSSPSEATRLPSTSPSRRSSGSPSHVPSSQKPTSSPSELPSSSPSEVPSSDSPSQIPSRQPSVTTLSQNPSEMPSYVPTRSPTSTTPSAGPTKASIAERNDASSETYQDLAFIPIVTIAAVFIMIVMMILFYRYKSNQITKDEVQFYTKESESTYTRVAEDLSATLKFATLESDVYFTVCRNETILTDSSPLPSVGTETFSIQPAELCDLQFSPFQSLSQDKTPTIFCIDTPSSETEYFEPAPFKKSADVFLDHQWAKEICISPRKLVKDGTLDAKYYIPENLISVGKDIGAGHFGTVYKGIYQNARVAMKMVNTAHYLREGNLFFQVTDHPNICRFFGLCEMGSTQNERRHFLVMEYFKHGSLLAVVKTQPKPFDTDDVKIILNQITAGVSHLHNRKIIHADIALRNCLARTVDDMIQVALTDFGMSCRSPAQNTLEVIPPRWASPELMQNQMPTFESDVWAMGITFIELLNQGGIPYPTFTSTRVADLLRKGQLSPQIDREWPEDIQKWLKCIFRPRAERIKIEDLANMVSESCKPIYERMI